MFKTLKNAFKIKDIRTKIFYTFLMIVVVRIGSQLPIPGVNRDYFSQWFAQQTGDAFGFFNAVTGGSFLEMSVFALNITPYITSSIIMQLLTIVIPKLEEMQKDGEDGRKKIASITRYVTVVLALVQATAMSVGFGNKGLLQEFNFINVLTVIVALTAGSAMLMWIGERITENGVGNGISIVLLVNIVSRIPADLATLFETFVKGKAPAYAILAVLIIVAVILVTTVLTIILQGGERKISVQYAKKMQGRKMVGGQSTHIPLKVNTAGVIPIIFASSLLQFPVVIASLLGKSGSEWVKFLSSSNWCDPNNLKYSIGLLVYIVLVVFFAYFYTSITFNPLEVANNLKKQGGFIPGIRPGTPTSDYLTKILNNIIFIGAVFLIVVAVIPIFFNGVFGAQVTFGGTSLIIIVGVVLETIKQIESQMLVRYYKGFLNDK
ncbi:MAG: preprotein translocase subunit SecY [Lachnospiraceae bacterium]|nr:preprotein translocase subunit SecY [Lachnospiraceae bacterium]